MTASPILWAALLVGGAILGCIGYRVRTAIQANRVRPEFLLEQVTENPVAGKFRLKPGDEIWWYSTAPCTWQRLQGRAGYAQVRGGKIIKTVLILMN